MNLKRITISLFAGLMLLTACTGDAPEIPASGTSGETGSEGAEYSLAEDYLIVPIMGQIDSYLTKLNVHTGALTPLCSDPVCTHDNDYCLMNIITDGYQRLGSKLYYKNLAGLDNGNSKVGLFSYDLKTAKTELILAYDEENPDAFPDGYSVTEKCVICFYKKIRDGAEKVRDELGAWYFEMDDEYYEIWRLDLSTKEMVKFGDTQDFVVPFSRPELVDYDDETLTWIMNQQVIVTDYDYNIISSEKYDRSTYTSEVGGYEYFSQRATDPDAVAAGAYDFYIVDDFGEKKLIIENCQQLMHVGDSIVYTKYDKDKSELLFSKDEVELLREDFHSPLNNEIYIMNADGSNPRLLGVVDDPYIDNSYVYLFDGGSEEEEKYKNGVCVGFLQHYYTTTRTDDETKEEYVVTVSELLGGIVMIDTKTDELKVIYVNDEPYNPERDISAELKK